MAARKTIVVEHLRRARLAELFAKGTRLDGRGFLDYRSITIETNPIEKANASAKVTIGNTQVIAGIKVDLATPFPDTPDHGLLIVNVELLPLSSHYAEPGPPSEYAIELARVVDRGVRESKMIDLAQLAIVKGKKVYGVFADVSVLDDDGNLLDTIAYAVGAAVATTKIPKYEVHGDEVKATGEMIPLPVRTIPISVTMAKIGETLIVDPNTEEEALMEARITLTSDHEGHLCAGQKGNPGGFSADQIMQAVDIAIQKGKEIRELLKRSAGLG